MKITKGKIFRLTVEVSDERLKAMREAKGNAEDALMAGAEYWHDGILPKHFEKGAGSVYGYAPRAAKYLRDPRKGAKPALVFTGSLRQDMTKRAAYQRVGSAVNLKMTARVLNFAPAMPENSGDLYVKHKNGRGYPNLKREIKAFTEDEREMVAAVVAADLERSFAPSDSPSKTAAMATPTTSP